MILGALRRHYPQAHPAAVRVVQQIMGHKSATMTRPVRVAATTDVAALNWADFGFLRPYAAWHRVNPSPGCGPRERFPWSA